MRFLRQPLRGVVCFVRAAASVFPSEEASRMGVGGSNGQQEIREKLMRTEAYKSIFLMFGDPHRLKIMLHT